MPDPKDTEGVTPEPAPQQPRAEQPTTPLPTPDQQPAQPTAEQPAAAQQADPEHVAAASAAEPPPPGPAATPQPTETASAAEAPAGPPPPAAGPAYATAPPPRRRFRQVAAHRATQLVAVGVLGLIIGGGLVSLLDHDGYRGGHGRSGLSRMDDHGASKPGPGPRGNGPRWDDHGRFER